MTSAPHQHTGHQHTGHHEDRDRHGHPDHAELLDLDAELLGPVLDEITGWAAGLAPERVRAVVDLGAGTGTGTIALARRFPDASLTAVDGSPSMLEHLRTAVTDRGFGERLLVRHADLDAGWPAVGTPDLVWAAASLHHLSDPEAVLRAAHDALAPGGVLVAVEWDHQPRFLTDAAGRAFEDRAAAVMAAQGWNAHPDWRDALERAGFDVTGQRTFPIEVTPVGPAGRRYARLFLGRLRSALAGHLDHGDVALLDRLLDDDGPESVHARADLAVAGSRTVWVARRP